MTPRKKAPAEAAAPSFEEALDQLEGIVDRLEDGDLDLEQALLAFEAGVKLSRQCAAQLDAAEQRVEVLVRQGRELVARPFEADEESDG
jgi:exodeoxyribonuclease VII small subunit